MPILQPQQVGMVGSSPRDTALLTQQQRAGTLADLGKVGGKRRKRGGMITVPVVPNQNLMNNPSGGSTGVSNQITGITSVTAKNDANGAFDNNVKFVQIPKGSTGGSKSKKSRKTKSKKSKKSSKTKSKKSSKTKSKKSRKTKKSKK